ncbi:hypothetical protein ASD30_07060 [Nocardioides sp. Root140]|nr:hypothetical protein ASD30_07060 [Nocardioides sp. Root140]KRF13170.1 hypothetical protein ASH02_13415 [Nocardioides sp. Soil796]
MMVAWQLTIDANDPARLVKFWAPLLGYEVQPPPAGFDTWNDYYRSLGVPEHELDTDGDGSDRIFDPNGEGPTIWFQIVPEHKSGKNRLHLDLFPTGRDRSLPMEERVRLVDAKVAEVVAAGATVLRRNPADFPEGETLEGFYAVTLGDPEGNEFCVA